MFPDNPELGQTAQVYGVWFEWDGWTWSRLNAPAPPPPRQGVRKPAPAPAASPAADRDG
jgi:hypothetical protein